MSANVDFVRSIYAAWERGDFTSVEWAHPDIEFAVVDGPDPRSTTGLAGMAESMRRWISAWDEFRVEAKEHRELDGGRVLALVRLKALGKTSGLDLAQVQTSGANLFHIREGMVTRLAIYASRDHALADLGLAE
jgi:ketosteroid isomerase-like protein